MLYLKPLHVFVLFYALLCSTWYLRNSRNINSREKEDDSIRTMPVIERVVRPTTRKGKKALISKEPKLVEDAKQTVYLRGNRTSEIVVGCTKDLYDLKKPQGQMLRRNEEIRPFEDATPIERHCQKLNCPLFVFVSHSKKRPHNLIIGRTFEHSLLDMVEFGVESYVGLKDFKVDKIATGTKPLLVFNGEIFENNHEYGRIRNLLIDAFQREAVPKIRLQGLEHVLSFTAVDDKIHLRSYRTLLKKSGTRTPRIELEEIGPRLDLRVRRTKLASDDLFARACKRPKALEARKRKNVSRDALGTTHGRVHVGAQKIGRLQTRKMKGLRKTMSERKAERKRRNTETSEIKASPKRRRTAVDSVDC